jgi:hypothetical protein
MTCWFDNDVTWDECLKLRTKPSDLSQADDGAGQYGEGEMQVGTTLITYAEASEACQPGKAAFHHPLVPSEVGAAVHATSCNPGLDAASPAFPTAAPMIVAFVGVQLIRAPAWATTAFGPYTRYSVQRGHQHHAVVPVSRPLSRHSSPPSGWMLCRIVVEGSAT